MQTFDFAWTMTYRLAALPFTITPTRSWVRVDDDELRAQFGPWSLRTPRSNVSGVQRSGGFSFPLTAGPPHLSLTDRGVTFASNGDDALCVTFVDPVRVLDPTGRLRHPGITLTVADPPALAAALGQPLS